jgi:hypothetical protein
MLGRGGLGLITSSNFFVPQVNQPGSMASFVLPAAVPVAPAQAANGNATRGLGAVDRYWPIGRGSGLGQQAVVTSEIISPGDPRYIDIYPQVEAGGGISYPGSQTATTGAAGSAAGSPFGTPQAGAMNGSTSGTGAGSTTGIGPFAGGGGGSGFGPGAGLNLPNLCSNLFGTGALGQALCGNGLWLILGGLAILLLFSRDRGRR